MRRCRKGPRLLLGLMYAPGSGASAQEYDGLFAHSRPESGVYAIRTCGASYSAAGWWKPVEEQISIAEESECRLQISHLQAAGPDHWPLQQRAIAAIEQAFARGVDVGF